MHNALKTCVGKLNEIVDPAAFPTDTVQTSARGIPGAATTSFVTEKSAGAPAGLTEDEVLVIYEQTFAGGRPFSSQIFMGQLNKLWENIVETSKFG